MTASTGYKKAADYVVRQFKSFGLEPGWQDADDSKTYFQSVPFTRFQFGENNVLTVRRNGLTEEFFKGGNAFEFARPGKGPLDLPLHNPVFVGYGICEPGLGWDDFSSLDLEGKLAIILSGFPVNPNEGPQFPQDVRRKYSDRRNGDSIRFQNVIQRGAVGIIALPDSNVSGNWNSIVSQLKRSNLVPVEDYGSAVRGSSPVPSLLVHADLVSRLFKDLGFDPLTQDGDYRTFELDNLELGLTIDVAQEKVDCFNVIGTINGTNPELSDEYITLGAHLDHLGKDGNVVYRGANDNASSCVLILEVVEALARKPLHRPLMVVLFTAEEIGHFGSLHFVAHPPVPHENIILNINFEQIGAKSRTFDGVWAIGPSDQEESLSAAHKNVEEITLGFDDIESQIPVISGSDTLSFYQKGLPAIILGSGGFPEHHTPDDNPDLIDYDHLYRAARFVLAYIEEVGNAERQ
ncbi:MAG: M20/M25/M40 family metallo-hydrolase [Candidatus Aminicenantes bacterium]|nr:M20/M25/M40 family metallo-hydrolase [Candidatus Aminicenantes bacterium]